MTNLFFIILISAVVAGTVPIDFQPWLSQGDHGRDFYCFQAAAQGAVPYQDYWWVYGPLMPYYFAAFLKFLGSTMPAILTAKAVLDLGAALFIYLSIATLLYPFAGFIASLWFLAFQPDFFYTYNHTGGVTLLMAVLYTIALYIKNNKNYYLVPGLALLTLLAFVKINIGLFSLVAYLLSVAVIDKLKNIPLTRGKKLIYYFGAFGVPAFVLLIYFLLTQGLTVSEIRQCFPFLTNDQPYNTSLANSVKSSWQFIVRQVSYEWATGVFTALLSLSVIQLGCFLWDKKTRPETKNILLFAVILILFYLFNAPEYFKSGVLYRIYWSKPFSIVLVMLLILWAAQTVPRWARATLYCILIYLMTMVFLDKHAHIAKLKSADHYLRLERGKIFANNAPQWFTTVEDTTDFLLKTLAPGEKFFALPYDALYYYLAGRASPTRQLIFFEHINIYQGQEERIIAELEKEKVNYVLISSRAYAREPGLGEFGKTYCQVLGSYISRNFEEIQRFGNWTNDPGWSWGHGTKILKRIER